MKFAEFTVGQVFEAGPVEVDEDSIVRFAAEWDPQWFHTDPLAARRSRFGSLIASGWQTCCIGMRMAVEQALAGSEVIASPGLEQLRWPNPVRAGDRLRWSATVLEVRRSRSQPTLGILRWHWTMRNQRDEVVLELEATNLFDLAKDPVQSSK